MDSKGFVPQSEPGPEENRLVASSVNGSILMDLGP